MKELSIEEKARRYDEVIKKAEVLYKTAELMSGCNVLLETVFPELAESEDERIRKTLINGFNKLDKSAVWYNGITNAQVLDWLEKQANHANFRNKIEVGDKVTRNEDGVLVNLSQLNRVAKVEEKQGEQKPYGQRQECADCQFNYAGECKGSCGMKQGEQKPILDFKAKDWYVSKVDGKINNIYNSVDKVEPKFKVGDWVVNMAGALNQVVKVYDDGYTLDDNTFLSNSWATEHYHLWTIQEAKDGDVLYESDTDSLLVFKSQTCGWIKVYCDYWVNKDKFTGSDHADYGRISEMNLLPATKEQRDLLFQKIKEAGYEWDAEKKELKKVEQKPWSEEDEGHIDTITSLLENRKKEQSDWGIEVLNEEIDWLKSIRPQSQWKPSDEQMVAISTAIGVLGQGTLNGKQLIELQEQLKKLKD